MHNIRHLASLTAERARNIGVRPNQIVRTICKENGVHEREFEDIKKLILSECGRRGGSKKPRAPRRKHCKFELLFKPTEQEMFEDAVTHEAAITANIPAHDL